MSFENATRVLSSRYQARKRCGIPGDRPRNGYREATAEGSRQRLPFPRIPSLRFPNEAAIYLFLKTWFNHDICYHMTGGFVYYLADVLNSYRKVTLFVALKDNEILNLLFQRGPTTFTEFYIVDFHFTLFVVDEADLVMYRVTDGDGFNMVFPCYGIDSRTCGPHSNMDFVHFTWRNVERFGLRIHSITLIPSDDYTLPLMRCLRDYMALSEGWRYRGNCYQYVDEYCDALRVLCDYRSLFDDCSCNVCRRQPPSMHLAALHTTRTGFQRPNVQADYADYLR